MVELVTQWPGHAAEEVERLTTLPLELAMNGTPQPARDALGFALRAFRRDPHFRRRHRRLFRAPGCFSSASRDAKLPPASRPAWRRCSARAAWSIATSSRVRTARPQELKTFEDWIVERAYRSVPGVADDSGFGGPTMQYQCCSTRRGSTTSTSRWRRWSPRSLRTTPIPAADFIRRAGSSTTCAASACCRTTEDIGEVRGRQQQRRAGARQGYRPRGDRPRAAARHFRLPEQIRRRRRRRDPDAPRRADAERAQRRGAEDRRAESQRSCRPT